MLPRNCGKSPVHYQDIVAAAERRTPLSTLPIRSVFRDLFSAPLDAAVDAETDYRQAWADWLMDLMRVVTGPDGNLREGVDIMKLIESMAPVVAINGVIDVAITMRIAEARDSAVRLDGGLRLGPVFLSGGFSENKSTNSES